MYILKNIKEFAHARVHSKDLIYGVDFVYNSVNNYFLEEDKKIVDMMEEYGMSLLYTAQPREFRSMYVGGPSVRRLMEALLT